MPGRLLSSEWRRTHPSTQYVIPFAAFAVLLLVFQRIPERPGWVSAARVLSLATLCVFCWPRELPSRPVHWLSSAAVGLFVFAVWIAPDLLFAGYRNNIFFSNPMMGNVHVSLDPSLSNSPWFLFWRTARAALVVPIVEELFWRAWLMRWLISSDFKQVPLGTYSPFSFWIAAILFASEHGPYWDVGLLTGVIYNSWMIRTKSLADCILMHAVTNGALSLYVIATRQWQYWQ